MTSPDMKPTPNAGVLDIAAYVPGKSAVPAGVRLHKLSANETPLGASPQASAAAAAVMDKLHDYPDGSSSALRDAIARRHGLNPSRILCGNGSDELLGLVAQCYLRRATRRFTPSTASWSIRSRSGRPVPRP